MRMRIMTFFLSLSVLLGMIVIPNSASAADNVPLREYEILKAVGIFKFDEETFNTKEGISTGDFIVLLINSLGGNLDKYSDNVLSAAQKSGLIGNESIEPLRFIEYSKALELAKKALAFGNDIEQERSSQIDFSDLTKGISAGKSNFISCDNAIRLIYNMVNIKGTYYVTGYDAYGYKKLRYNKDATLLLKFRNIYEVKGIVTENKYTSMYEEGELSDNDLKIDGTLFHSKEDLSDFLGMNTTSFVQREDSEDVDTIIYMEERIGKNEMLTIAAEDLNEWNADKTKLSYYSNNRSKTISIDKTASFIYNGVACTEFSDKILLPNDGYIDFIDNNDDGKYDVVKISSYEYLPVENVATASKTIYSKYAYAGCLQKLELDTDDSDIYIDITKNGEPIQLRDIKEWDILTVRRSLGDNPKRIMIEVSDDKITTTADSISLSQNEVTLDGNVYKLSDAVIQAMKDENSKAKEPSTDSEYTYYLSSDGKIAGIYGDISNNTRVGYLKNIWIEDNGETIGIKIFTDTGEWETYNLTSKLNFNDKREKSENVYAKLHPGNQVDCQLIYFRVNSKGEVNKITTSVFTKKRGYGGFSKSEKIKGCWRPTGKCFDSKIFLPAAPTIFVVPEDKKNSQEADYRIASTADFVDGREYTFEAYNVDEFGVAEFIVLSMDYEINTFAIVEDIWDGVDSDDNQKKIIHGKIGDYLNFEVFISEDCTTFKDYYDSETVYSINDLKAGDILRLAMDTKGDVVQIQRMYTLSDGYKPHQTNEVILQVVDFSNFEVTNSFDVTYKYTSAKVEKTSAENSLILLNYEYDFGSRTQALKVDANTKYTVVDGGRGRGQGTAKTGSFNDIEPGDYVFIDVWASVARDVIIIKNIEED